MHVRYFRWDTMTNEPSGNRTRINSYNRPKVAPASGRRRYTVDANDKVSCSDGGYAAGMNLKACFFAISDKALS